MQIALRPLRPDDRTPLVRVVEQLSLESRLNRFFAPVQQMSDSMLEQLTNVDQRDRFAWLAVVEDDGEETPIAVARYARAGAGSSAAELGIAVADRFHGRRVGTVLLCALALVARLNGIERFVGQVRTENGAMRALLRGLGADLAYDEPGVLRFELPLDAVV